MVAEEDGGLRQGRAGFLGLCGLRRRDVGNGALGPYGEGSGRPAWAMDD